MPTPTPEQIDAVERELGGRRGFRQMLDEIDDDTRLELFEAVARAVVDAGASAPLRGETALFREWALADGVTDEQMNELTVAEYVDRFYPGGVEGFRRAWRRQRYPHEDGDVIVLGPEVFVARDGSVLSWRGQNYVPQAPPVDGDAHWALTRELANDLQGRASLSTELARERRAAEYIDRARALPAAGGEREVRELLCQRCDREYPVWSAPNDLWNRVVRDHGGDGYGARPLRDRFLCPSCFGMLAEERGIKVTPWLLVPLLWLDDETRDRFAKVTHWPRPRETFDVEPLSEAERQGAIRDALDRASGKLPAPVGGGTVTVTVTGTAEVASATALDHLLDRLRDYASVHADLSDVQVEADAAR